MYGGGSIQHNLQRLVDLGGGMRAADCYFLVNIGMFWA